MTPSNLQPALHTHASLLWGPRVPGSRSWATRFVARTGSRGRGRDAEGICSFQLVGRYQELATDHTGPAGHPGAAPQDAQVPHRLQQLLRADGLGPAHTGCPSITLPGDRWTPGGGSAMCPRHHRGGWASVGRLRLGPQSPGGGQVGRGGAPEDSSGPGRPPPSAPFP